MKKRYNFFLIVILISFSNIKAQEVTFKTAGTKAQYVPVLFSNTNSSSGIFKTFNISRTDIHEDQAWLAYGSATITAVGFGWGSGGNSIRLDNFTNGVENSDNTGKVISFIGRVICNWAGHNVIVYLRGDTTYRTDGVVLKNDGYFSDINGGQNFSPVSILDPEFNIPKGSYFSDFEISNKNSASLSIAASRNIGIGTTDPQAKLHINNGDNSYGSILANANEKGFSLYTKSLTTNGSGAESFRIGLKYYDEENNGFISFHRGESGKGGFLGFSTDGKERMKLDRDGNVGIGSTKPLYKLDTGILAFDTQNGASLRFGNGERDTEGDLYPTSIKAFFNAPTPTNLGLNFYIANANPSGATEMDRKKLVATMLGNGNVGIGTPTPQNELSVNGTIWAKAVKVSLTDAADWVFDKNYKLRSLAEVEKYINQNKHLPEVPSAEEFRQNDLNVSEMTNKLLQKIEELTLYVIELKKENNKLKSLNNKVSIIEQEIKKLKQFKK